MAALQTISIIGISNAPIHLAAAKMSLRPFGFTYVRVLAPPLAPSDSRGKSLRAFLRSRNPRAQTLREFMIANREVEGGVKEEDVGHIV
jgi:hypothetical protein